ncbi:glycoside hydrolase family 127 protein [Phytohabitans sp. ZYX-F-186]|uniref:Glycoside hydrolase family 127 protein n=1 Tax=Phytohabitans maris TaxID=3071409 RepID=A0ABU0ZIG7_9ACTN|nr:beta-L-arabinofuranosidase domain-containing protein [Phytohabitans sp. ZYX-F-186]MDQ7906080.1 glycoside hydrolase family 127 protein [Phytohabitans sp. ZYX-F-186]
MSLSRRTVLRAGAAGAVAAAGVTALKPTPAVAARPDTGVSAYAFPLSAVTLLAGPFQANMGRTHSYLGFLDADRLLHTFRLNVGLPSSAAAMGGWETPTTELRGHSTGHVLSALAQGYANGGPAAFKTKGDYLVAELAKCQDRATAAGFNTGYLSAYPESFIDRVEARQSVWAPYYTLHKIMAGLLDMHLLAGNAQALTVLTRMAAWVKLRNDRLTLTQRQNMLDTEFGGMNEVLTNLYQLTADPNHLAAAQHFDHAEIFDPLASNVDALNNYHANTQIPKVLGAIREYHATGTIRYRDIAVNFWDIVTGRHSYAIGGNSNGEYFKAPNRIASELSDTTCECCNTYNMLKLTRQLFFTNPARADYMDYYEKALYNHILGAQNPSSSHGFHCYYVPLRPGGIKTYSNDYDNWTCCHGTGMESNTKYADSIYFHSGDTLYVNLFVASVLTWPGRGITVRQETTFPEAASTRLTVTGSGAFTLRVRIPSWTSGAQLRLNGAVQSVAATPGTYATMSRTWTSGDVVEVSLPMSLARESTPDNAAVQAVRYGPVVLAGAYGTSNLSSMPTLNPATLAATSTPLQFTGTASTGAVTLLPFYKTHGQRYTVYWNVNTTPPPAPFVAHYRFDETSGTAAADATGNGRTATLGGGAGWTGGRTGGAVDLNGTSGYVSLPAGILAGATACTVAAWVRLDTVANWSRLFDLGSGSTASMFLTPRSSAGTARFAITTSGSGGEQRINAPAALPTGAWTHVAVTLSGGLGVLYLNGAEVARNAALTLRPADLGSTTQNWIGRSQYGGDPYLDGAVDGFRLYSRALTAAEVADLHATGQ